MSHARSTREIRSARPGDISGILELQTEYFVGNLDREARKGGFISSTFTRRQFEEIAQDVALLVAAEHTRIVAYLCAASSDYYRQFPLLEALRQRASDMIYLGRRLDSYRSFIYGPVCIARLQRGRGLLGDLFEQLLRVVPTAYDIGIALISKDNRPSFEAHVRKLGMTAVGDYEFGDHRYDVVAFTVPRAPHQSPVESPRSA